ncbi:hypothetical protein GQ53DRAFT_584404, partial [Thozetella sp. PMI_491]
DVLVLGGGASGAYVAAQLTDIYQKNVLVVERASRLGGHVNTIDVPGVDHPIEFGVQAYHNLSFVTPFFNRYGINTTVGSGISFTSVPLDQVTAKPVNITVFSAEDQQAALGRWLEFGLKYKEYIYPKYDLPTPLGDAAPLARPFIETVKELQLEPIVLSLEDAHWANDLLALPTLQAVSTFGFPWFDGTPLVVPESHNNTELYGKIQEHLGDKVRLNTHIQSVRRDQEGSIKSIVRGPGGCTKVYSKHVVVAFVPTEDNMAPFDTTDEEDGLFSKWDCVTMFNGLLTIEGMPNATDLDPVSSDPDRYFVPKRPNARFINLADTPYSAAYVVGEPGFDTEDAKHFLEERLTTIREAGAFPVGDKPKYWGFDDHSPLVCSVGQEEMVAGFWSDITALQGQRNTWYVGQAFAADLSAYVWAQAQEVVDAVIKKL